MEFFWSHPMDPLGDVGEMKARFGPFGDSGSLHGARLAPNMQ
jgi:hypothetical protein